MTPVLWNGAPGHPENAKAKPWKRENKQEAKQTHIFNGFGGLMFAVE